MHIVPQGCSEQVGSRKKCNKCECMWTLSLQGILMSGQKVVDMDVPENGLSEVLRLFIKSRSGHEEEVGLSERYLFIYLL